MADTKISALTNYTALIGADIVPVVDTVNSTTKGMTLATLGTQFHNHSVSSQTPFSSDTYLTGSSIPIPSGSPYVGTRYIVRFDVTKTAAGTATPIINVRIGTAGTVADTAILTFTFGAGTAAADVGMFEVICVFRTVGSGTSAVLQGVANLTNNLTITGISNAVKTKVVTSSGFNSTTSSLFIGASYNGGASAAHTVQLVRSELQF